MKPVYGRLAMFLSLALSPQLVYASIHTAPGGAGGIRVGQAGDNLHWDGSYDGNTNGGPFYFYTGHTAPVANDQGWLTFCLEENEFISSSGDSHNYFVADTSSYAVKGGVASNDIINDDKDYISKGTAFLYQSFAKSEGYTTASVANFNSALGLSAILTDVDWLEAIQLVIWRLEDEISDVSDPWGGKGTVTGRLDASLIWTSLLNIYGTKANLKSDNDPANGNSLVRALNIMGPDSLTTYAQSQLTIVDTGVPIIPQGFADVPEPATMLTWGALSLLGLAFARRKQNNRSAVQA